MVGARNGQARLTEAQVGEIRRRYAEGGVSQDALAAEFSVSQAQIWNIVRGRSWQTERTSPCR